MVTMSGVVRISKELLPYIDAAIMQVRDESGAPIFKYRAEVVNAALKEYMKNHGVKPLEAPTQPSSQRERGSESHV